MPVHRAENRENILMHPIKLQTRFYNHFLSNELNDKEKHFLHNSLGTIKLHIKKLSMSLALTNW